MFFDTLLRGEGQDEGGFYRTLTVLPVTNITRRNLEPRDKRQVVEEMLSKGDTMICLDSRHPDVQVPANHRGKEDLRLVLNLNFRHSVSTLPDGIQAELLFGGVPCLCWIPYKSLWAVYNPQTGEGHLWPGETPVSLRGLSGDRPGSEEERGDVESPAHSTGPKASVREETTFASGGPGKTPGRSKKPGPPGPEKPAQRGRPRFRVIEGGKKH